MVQYYHQHLNGDPFHANTVANRLGITWNSFRTMMQTMRRENVVNYCVVDKFRGIWKFLPL